MKKYLDLTGNSGVMAFEIGEDSITVQFKDGGAYLYNARVTGKHHVERMKQLARKGQGLATYINQHVRKSYAKKLG